MEQPRAKGQRWVISTQREMLQAVIDVAREARRRVSIYTHDLEPGIYDDPDFLEVIKHMVLSQSYSRIRVLIADPTRAIKNGNAFVHLGRRRSARAEMPATVMAGLYARIVEWHQSRRTAHPVAAANLHDLGIFHPVTIPRRAAVGRYPLRPCRERQRKA